MKTISLVYISLSGNTESFVTRLKDYLLSQYKGIEVQKIHIKDLVKEGKNFYEMDHPYVAFLPTYLEGGNGVDNGDVEILTTPVGDFIAYGNNASKCFGVVGSGNRNFNNQYCLTAKQYSQRFGFLYWLTLKCEACWKISNMSQLLSQICMSWKRRINTQ